jgi:hypothetical protein
MECEADTIRQFDRYWRDHSASSGCLED